MRIAFLVLCLVTLAASLCLASVVMHDLAPGVISQEGSCVLLGNGHVWRMEGPGWEREEVLDPPMPVEEIRWWGANSLVTVDNVGWENFASAEEGWRCHGTPPDLLASVAGEPMARSGATVSPNPSPGSCRVSFRVPSDGEVSATVLDVSGRVVRNLLSGPHPAGDYSLAWDGRDDNGREVPAGVYLTRIETAEGVTSGKVVLSR